MKVTVVLGANQILSHGFGVFLFAALFPFMRDTLGLTHWHLAAVGIATQVSYLSGALSVGYLGRHLTPEKLILITGAGSSALLLALALLSNPLMIIAALSILAFSAAVCWSAIVGLISQHVAEDKAAISLAAAGKWYRLGVWRQWFAPHLVGANMGVAKCVADGGGFRGGCGFGDRADDADAARR